jgi:hypothetical protein
MRRGQIEVGKTYSDGKGGLRKILEIGPDRYESECVTYAKLAGKGNGKASEYDDAGNPIYGCYTHSFQIWAKTIVEV